MILPKKNIIWLASYPKSGNTWIRLLLSSIHNPEKSHIDINNIDNTIIASNRSLIDNLSGTNSSDLTTSEINSIRPEVYRMLSAQEENNIYIKVHDLWQKNNNACELFPSDITKGVLLIVRNPFDLVISYSNFTGLSIKESISKINNTNHYISGNKSRLSSQVSQRIGSWSEHFHSWADDSNLTTKIIRYEDMIQYPFETFSSVLNFFGIFIEDSHIKSAINKCSFNTIRDQEIKHGFKEKPMNSGRFFNTGKMNYWKEILDTNDIISLEEKHSEVLKRLNYL